MKILIVTSIMIALTLGVGSRTVSADVDYDTALKSSPEALALTGIFQTGTGTVSGASNVATVVTLDAKGNVVPEGSATADKSLVKITDAQKQVGSEWSTAGNKFDINKDNLTTMWMYFGNAGGNSGDGMAFVLQNDARGTAAISGAGQSLGVWGVDNGGWESEIANSAIKNSWALEFDTHRNGDKGTGSGFDNLDSINDNHVASAYPNQKDSYERHLIGFSHYSKLGHNSTINTAKLSNGKWWHVTLDYKSSGLMTYTIGDKDPSTGAALAGQTNSFNIDKSKFDSATGQLTWGFTGATGDKYENNLVMFEKISSLVSANAIQKVTDVTQNNADVTNNGTVVSGDELNFQSTLTYKDGKQDWQKIEALLQVPNDVTLDKEATIKYADGTIQKFDTTKVTNKAISAVLSKSLSKTNNTATISMNGTANTVTSDTKVASPASAFNGKNAMITSNAAAFTIKASQQRFTITGLVNQTINVGQAAKVAASIKTDTILESNVLSVTTKLNGAQLSDELIALNKLDPYPYSETIPANKLKLGDNTYTIRVDDGYGDSKTVQSTITVKDLGKIDLTTVNDLNFGTIPIPQSTTTYNPVSAMNVELEASLPGSWNLGVEGSDVVGADRSILKGALIYKDSVNAAETVVNSNSLTILNGQSSASKVTKTWAKDTGILLKVKPSEVKTQSYKATINWTLSHTPTE
ncbi:cell surface protein [Dellaglioa algida]|uniref:Cell surface protein n=2 Tax=Dellaglioa algida TaxID=105612 RepID=A0A5C6MBR9_9LACO|nr:cell surface protein [Dellaglioa algida]